MRRLLLALCGCWALATAGHCAAQADGGYRFESVRLLRVYDGDTLTVSIPGIHPLLGESIGVRVAGIDTPERRGRCDKEKVLAEKARRFVQDELAGAKAIHLEDANRDKYFRIVARVLYDVFDPELCGEDEAGCIAWERRNLGGELLRVRLAVPYDGGTKTFDWCASG